MKHVLKPQQCCHGWRMTIEIITCTAATCWWRAGRLKLLFPQLNHFFKSSITDSLKQKRILSNSTYVYKILTVYVSASPLIWTEIWARWAESAHFPPACPIVFLECHELNFNDLCLTFPPIYRCTITGGQRHGRTAATAGEWVYLQVYIYKQHTCFAKTINAVRIWNKISF